MSSFHDFIKVNKRLGVALKNNKNLEKIFLYFAENEDLVLNYKKFCEDIFYFISSEERNNKNISNFNSNEIKETFNEILTRKILDKKVHFTLLELIKNIKLIDYENYNIIFFNDFIRALKRTDILLKEEEKIKIFEQCDYYINKNLHYNYMINTLLDKFWSEEKNELCEEIFFLLTNYGKKCISLNYIEKYFKNIFSENDFLIFIEKYKLIYKNNSLELISLKDFITLFKYYNFGEYKSDFLKEVYLSIKQTINSKNKNDKYYKLKNYFSKNCNKTFLKKKYHYSRSIGKNNIKKERNSNNYKKNLYKIISKIKNTFIEYGRLSFFNFIKQFKYYEINDNLITKNSFSKVFNNFNIKLTSEDIDLIFNELGVDYSKNYIYHEDFIKFISVKCLNKKRDDIIKYVFDYLFKKSGGYNETLSIKYLKNEYNPKNNYFTKSEGDNYLEFIDCIEIYHFSYKSFKYDNIDKKEFVDFYRIISFLINNDNDFIYLISNEWRIPLNILLENTNDDKENKNHKQKQNYFLIDLKEELIKKGVKCLLNIHYKFMTFCINVSKITLNDFINIMNLNHTNFDINEFKDIFAYFSIESNNTYLDYTSFIRFFKKELNESKLRIVEKIFLSLKNEFNIENENIPINLIKNKYKAKKHPEVLSGKITENEKIQEFMECFDINFEIMNPNEKNDEYEKLVDFDIFANFYEYVSFIYDSDDEFENLLISTWY